MALDNEPRALAADVLSQVLNYIKQSTPTRTDGKATQGFVYSTLRVGQMISPKDFAFPWSPIGGSPAQTTPGPQPPPGDPAAAAAEAQAKAAAQASTRRAINAAFKTEQLVNTMLVVTNDGTLETYSGGGRHLDFAYHEILQAMEAEAAPPRSDADKARLDAATKVLYDENNNETPAYKTYQKNQADFAAAQAAFTVKSNQLLANPLTADSAPLLLRPEEVAVKQARDRWRSQGAEEIEAALATRESMGVPLEQGAIMDARALYDAWNIPVIGVGGASQPFSYVLPSDWAALESDESGWTTLTVTHDDYSSHFDSHGYNLNTGNWAGQSEATSGDAGISVFGFGFNGSYSEADSNSHSESSTTGSDGSSFRNDAKNLSVSLQYGLCEIARPWLMSDLFRLQNWHLVGETVNSISTGTIDEQVGSEKQLLPMFPTHFLVIRNVSISAEDWGSDGETLSTYYSKHDFSQEEHSSTVSGGVEVPVFGPICLDAGASHSESGFSGGYQDESGNSFSNDYKAHFDGSTLTVKGAQIVAWLSEVVPASPPKDDPALAAPQ